MLGYFPLSALPMAGSISAETIVTPSKLGTSWHPGRGMNNRSRFFQRRQGISSVAASSIVFRKTLSNIGSRTGSRQTHNE